MYEMSRWLSIAAINGAIAVAAGAFAAHSLKAILPVEMLEIFKTGAQYQLIHALAIAICAHSGSKANRAAPLFLSGIILFSGSLYALALTGYRTLGIITPFGGICFIVGWLMLAWTSWKHSTET
jgi:uncharacterized membrane protein YgdD (TMEM256/DUF423 family)